MEEKVFSVELDSTAIKLIEDINRLVIYRFKPNTGFPYSNADDVVADNIEELMRKLVATIPEKYSSCKFTSMYTKPAISFERNNHIKFCLNTKEGAKFIRRIDKINDKTEWTITSEGLSVKDDELLNTWRCFIENLEAIYCAAIEEETFEAMVKEENKND